MPTGYFLAGLGGGCLGVGVIVALDAGTRGTVAGFFVTIGVIWLWLALLDGMSE